MPGAAAIGEALVALYEDTLEFYGCDLGMRIARKHIAWTIDAHAPLLDAEARRRLRGDICRLTAPREVIAALTRLFGDDGRRAAA
jgi:tRNA-dihydrouridine synthase